MSFFSLNETMFCLQDSAAVQILLEVCLPTTEEQLLGAQADGPLRSARAPWPTGKWKQGRMEQRSVKVEAVEPQGGLLSDLREVQCLICCLIHQMFIADPNIAKLVHFQVTRGVYKRERTEAMTQSAMFCI